MRSVMRHQFSQVPRVEIPRSSFDRSHGYKTTHDAGKLYPVFVDEALPGDTFNCRMTTFSRLSTPLHPIMDNMFLDAFFFAIPLRLVWNNFVRMMGEQDNPSDSTSYLVPTITSPAGGYVNGSIFDYMGLPTQVPGIVHSALFLRAYNLVYNQWFRDQNLQNSVPVSQGDGPDAYTNYVLLNRGKRHDYFTSALPWPQKGPAVSIPLGQSATVKTNSTELVTTGGQPMYLRNTSTGAAVTGLSYGANGSSQLAAGAAGTFNGASVYPTNLYADLSAATAATINQLRQAFQIQRIYERDARGGTRYTELILSHFGVQSPDARLQRPEYLGGGSTPISINPIAQTSNTSGSTTPQGNLAAIGTSSLRGVGFTKSFTEHSIILGMISVRADLNYQQGLNRMWTRSTRFDFYWPALAHIGEQVVLNQEIYSVGSAVPGQDASAFGYQERYAEYRYKPSIITGQFRSNYATPLDSWHLAEYYTSLPTLGNTWIQSNPPVARVVAVPSQPLFLTDIYFQMQCARPMPVYGVPGNIDRF